MPGDIMPPVKSKTAASRLRANESSRPRELADRLMDRDQTRNSLLASIDELHALSRRGLWGILLFLAMSAVTLYCQEAGLFALVPGEIRELFGDPPPAHLLHFALAVSWLSALVLILGRVTGEGRPMYSWYNVGLPTAFYPLYIFSDPAGAHVPTVFAAGLILLTIEHLSVQCYASRAIREKMARLDEVPH